VADGGEEECETLFLFLFSIGPFILYRNKTSLGGSRKIPTKMFHNTTQTQARNMPASRPFSMFRKIGHLSICIKEPSKGPLKLKLSTKFQFLKQSSAHTYSQSCKLSIDLSISWKSF
jgi:hypothetical protein